MFRFQHVNYFWFLFIIPILVFAYLYFLGWRKNKLKRLGDSSMVRKLIKGKIDGRLTTKLVLISLTFACLITALANLQAGGHAQKSEQKGLDVMFALDVSNSMLARDVEPNRLGKAKELIYRMLVKMKNDRTGLVIFAGNAYLQVPMTTDYAATKMLLSSVTPGMVPTQGTDLSSAINLADESFSKKEKQYKVLILISDGEDHDQGAIKSAKAVSDNGMIIYTIGLGSPRGSTIYDPSTGQPKLDREGKVIITKLNETELKDIADATGGYYQLLNNASQVSDNLIKTISQLGTKNLGLVVYTDYKSYFQYFLGASLILFLISWFLPDAKKVSYPEKKPKTDKKKLSTSVSALLIMGFAALGLMLSPQKSFAQKKEKSRPTLKFKKKVNEGNKLYRTKNYDSSQALYREALTADSNSFEANYNLGDALYQSGNIDKAMAATNKGLKYATTKMDKADANHNIGNYYMKKRKWEEAVDAYKKSLLLNPDDRDTKYNLAYAQKMIKHNKNKQKNKNKDQKNKDQKNKDQKNKDQKDKDQKNKDQKNKDQKTKDQQKKDQQKKSDNKDQNKEKENGQQPKMQPSKLTKQQADNILNALNQEEKALHKRKKEQKSQPVQPEKDW